MRQLKITKSITNRETASLDKYLQEIGHEELISVEEEVELAQRIRRGDRQALEKLTRANLRFVVSVAKQYQNQGLSLADLINEGNLGLIKAAEKFDETRNWLGSRTERTLYKGSVFPVSRFVERIKDFNIDLKERVYRFIDSYTKDWISTITFDTGETYELEEALKKFREIMGLPKEEK